MRRSAIAPLFAAVSLLLAASARAENPKAVRPLAIGDTLPAFEAKTLDGGRFDLAGARATTREQALASVVAAAKAHGLPDANRETRLDTIPGLAKDGTADPAARSAFLADTGRPYGLVADPAKSDAWTTVGDVADWLLSAARAPLVLIAWSSGCPTCRLYDERLVAAAAATGARVYLLACNWNDTDDQLRAALAERHLPFPVLLDRDQRVTDVLGGRKTPHVFAFDEANHLRYAGAVDSDAALQGEESRRVAWLADALHALAEGRSFDVLVTAPKG